MALLFSKLRCVFRGLNTVTQNKVLQSVSPATYSKHIFIDEVGEVNTKYEATQDPADWKYVERILPLTTIPEPVKKETYPSGWRPQADNLKDRPYFIERTKNHMIPVYLHISQRGIRRHTFVRRIRGDIWLLEKELKKFLQKESFKPLRVQVHEFGGYIRINGDFVNAIKYWLEQRNF